MFVDGLVLVLGCTYLLFTCEMDKFLKKKPAGDDLDEDLEKTPCKYGADCFRKSKEHQENFGHPSKQDRKTKRKSEVCIQKNKAMSGLSSRK